MSVEFNRVKEGEFLRLLKTQSVGKVIAQQSTVDNKYHVIAVIAGQQIAYTVRHGRVDELRTWRLDNLAALLQSVGVKKFEIQMR
ncbi:hypothetical protein [Pseudoalteromonas rhizosphaerae]|uniref:hypothetical protein n=1 Tax=Pseudoalteromonas rhizosphaerae TaxID=2518973 RepID=UPI00384EE971